jgi:site-specific DNA recombinase
MDKIAAIYVRQSRNKPGERTTSPEVQEEACRALPAVAACEAVEVFSDLDVSGKSVKGRKGLQALLERVKAGGVGVVAAYDQSRTFRSTQDALEFAAFMGERADVEVVFVNGRFDRGAVGGFSYTVIAAAHEMERRMVGEKRADTDRRKAERGEARGMAPYGYQWSSGQYAINEEQAAVVRRIFEDYATGDYSAKALAARLNDEGVPRAGARTKHGWLPDTVVDTLRNVAYIGKSYSGAKRQGELIRAQWPAIVDEPTYKRVQSLMAGRKVKRRQAPVDYVFGRLLVCSRCGEIMRAVRNNGHVYYHCRRDVASPCTTTAVREDVLLAFIKKLFLNIAFLDETGGVAAAMLDAAEKRRKPVRSLASIEDAMDKQAKLFQWGHITEDQYLAERAKLDELRSEVAEAAAGPVKSADYFQNLFFDWRDADQAKRRRVLGRMFEALYVEDGEIVRYRPRIEHRAEIEAIIERAIALTGGIEYVVPVTGRGSHWSRKAESEVRRSPLVAFGGKGGIRTLEGELTPYPLSRRALSTTQPPPRSEGS